MNSSKKSGGVWVTTWRSTHHFSLVSFLVAWLWEGKYWSSWSVQTKISQRLYGFAFSFKQTFTVLRGWILVTWVTPPRHFYLAPPIIRFFLFYQLHHFLTVQLATWDMRLEFGFAQKQFKNSKILIRRPPIGSKTSADALCSFCSPHRFFTFYATWAHSNMIGQQRSGSKQTMNRNLNASVTRILYRDAGVVA